MKSLIVLIITASSQISLSKRGSLKSNELTVWNGDESLIGVTVSSIFSSHYGKDKLFDQRLKVDDWNETVWHAKSGENRPWIQLDLKVRFIFFLSVLQTTFLEKSQSVKALSYCQEQCYEKFV